MFLEIDEMLYKKERYQEVKKEIEKLQNKSLDLEDEIESLESEIESLQIDKGNKEYELEELELKLEPLQEESSQLIGLFEISKDQLPLFEEE